MSTEYEKKRARLVVLETAANKSFNTANERAEFLLLSGVDVALPPEPEWKPGQYAWLGFKGERLFVQRRRTSTQQARWYVVNDDGSTLTDDEVTDVEPVAVLAAEDVRELAEPWNDDKDAEFVREFFAERGLSVDE